MADLVNQFDELPTEIVCATLSIFGHHPSRALVETACIKLRGRVFSPQDRVKLVANAILGMTVLFEMMWMGCGTLKPAPRHPGLTVFRPLVQDWAAMTDYVPLDALRVGDEMARFGSGDALNGLRSRIMTVLQMPDTDLLDHTNAHLIGTAIRTLAERQCLLDLPFLESIVARCSHNAAAPAVQMIGAHGTRDALNILLKIHKVAEDSHLRGIVCDVVEVLSMRLGLRIKNEKSELLIESN